MDEIKLNELKTLIKESVFLTRKEVPIVSTSGTSSGWLFDFRKIFLSPRGLTLVSELFLEALNGKVPFQIAGVESAALPLVAAIIMKSLEKKLEINGFFIRKSRNKKGLLNKIEGKLENKDVVLVDDLINSGSSFLRQIEVVEEAGLKVKAVFSCVRFRDPSYYSFLEQKNIELISLFSLEDFNLPLLSKKGEKLPYDYFKNIWAVGVEDPNLFYVVPKSAPTIDDRNIYFGSDSGYMWALDQNDGSLVWKFKIFGFGSKGKKIFSTPAILNNFLYFGAYDGNFYALNKETGKEAWVFLEADWIGSSPAVSSKKGLVFIGLEFGLINKRGGIAALDAKTGRKVWQQTFTGLTHGSPVYSQKFNAVAIGSNDGGFYLLDADTGEIRFKIQTGGEIKGTPAFDEKRGLVIFNSFDRNIYIADVKTGKIIFSYTTGAGIYSIPVIYEDKLYVASLDKKLYCIDLNLFKKVWEFTAAGRIFASPIVTEDGVCIGSNDGRFHVLDISSGKSKGFFQSTERITNKATYNPLTKRYFVPTYANEIYCLERRFK